MSGCQIQPLNRDILVSSTSSIFSEKPLFTKIKEAANHTIIYGFGSVLQAALGFILIPLYTRYYSTDIYGMLALITICGAVASAIFYLGIAGSLSRSYFDYEDLDERKKVVSTSIFLSLIGACVQIALAFLLKEKLSILLFNTDAYAIHIFAILISTAIAFLNNLFYVILRFEKKSKQVVIVNLISLITSVSLITSFLVILELGLMAPIMGTLINQVLLLCVLFYLTKGSFGFVYSKPELKIQLLFGIPTMLTGLGHYLLISVDRFFINKFGTLDDVGVYSLGFLLASVINILLIMPFGQIWSPMRMEYRNDRNAPDLYKLVLTYYFILGWFITIVVSLFSKEIILLISGRPEYLVAYKVVPIVMMAFLIFGSMNIIDMGINFARKVIYHTYIFWACVILNFILNYTLIPIYGYMAAAYNILATFIVAIILVYVVSNRLFRIQLESRRLAKIFLSSGLVMTLGLYTINSNSTLILAIALKSVLIFALVVFWYAFVLEKSEKENILRVLKLSP